MPLPLAHGMIGASVVAALRPRFLLSRDWKLLLMGALLAISPDFDLFLAWVVGLGDKWHGSFTHSIVFAAAVGLLLSASRDKWRGKEAAVYGAAVLSHALLDIITRKVWGGAELLWPLSSRRLKLGLFDYFEFYPDPKTDSLSTLLAAGLRISLFEFAIFTPVLITVLCIRSRTRKEATRSTITNS